MNEKNSVTIEKALATLEREGYRVSLPLPSPLVVRIPRETRAALDRAAAARRVTVSHIVRDVLASHIDFDHGIYIGCTHGDEPADTDGTPIDIGSGDSNA